MNNTEDLLLNQISPYFNVKLTKYGGRGCFATEDIPSGTIISKCYKSLSSTIAKEFKKEVCHWCHFYDNGRSMKFKLSSTSIEKSKADNILSIGFCSSNCLELFKEYDDDDLLSNNLILIEQIYTKSMKTKRLESYSQTDNTSIEISELMIEELWSDVNEWETETAKMKPFHKSQLVPILSEEEYIEAKYILGISFELYKNDQAETKISRTGYVDTMSMEEYMDFEIQILELLQSNESAKIHKYPYLLQSFIKVYKFSKLCFPQKLQKYITTPFIRGIIGKELGNAFGLWSQTTNISEDKEYLGFSIYPSASFFNHSCDPNLKRSFDKVNKSTMIFKTNKEIFIGDEICINYGNGLTDCVELRQTNLKEWFFDCACVRCTKELLSSI